MLTGPLSSSLHTVVVLCLTLKPCGWLVHAQPLSAAAVNRLPSVSCLLQPVFGAGFNSGGGFAAFSGGTADAPKAEGGAVAGEEGEGEEECKAEFTPLVQLEEVEKTTGEENEDLLLELCVSILLTMALTGCILLCFLTCAQLSWLV